MADTPEQILHSFGPYLATDRFRSLLTGQELSSSSTGAAMIVDISGFTPLTVSLVKQYGPQRASEELKRRLNPMFEAIGGLVFTHGGSVLRFVGDGFTAWFPDELPHTKHRPNAMGGLIRASIAGLEMLETMIFFKDLDLKVAVYQGLAQRWVVGDARSGLLDVLAGEAVEGVAEVAGRCEKHQVRTGANSAASLAAYPQIISQMSEEGDIILSRASAYLVEQSSAHRWGAWQATEEAGGILEKVKQFIDPLIQQQELAGLGGLAGELRYATPLFVRFGGLDYNNDPHAQQKLDAYIRDVQAILEDTKGRLVSLEVADKGSVVFAVFGAPIAYGDDSRRAIHAALLFRDLPEIHPYISQQNIGLSRGLLYSGMVGGEVRHEYTSLGDETNVASRLMSADKTGRILLSQAVYEECSEWFDFAEGPVISPKGRVGSIPTFIPLHVKQRIRRNVRKLPIVGRDAELEHIQKTLENIGRGRPQILRIEGEAGIGKSRLAAELFHLAAEVSLVAVGHCLSTGQSTAYLPWRPLLRTLLDMDDDWSAAISGPYITRWLEERNPEWLARAPLLHEMMGLPVEDNNTTRALSGSARQQGLFALVVDIFYHLARRQKPICLVLEDTHWIDEVSEALAVECITRMTAEPVGILLVLLHRSTEDTPHPAHLLDTANQTYLQKHLRLNELSAGAVGQLVQHRMGGIVPEDLTQFIYSKAQGNAYFTLEIVDALEESNTIKRVGPRIYVEANLEQVNLPQTVQGLILARLDKLPEHEKLVLKLAAVIGRQFEIRVLYQSMPVRRSPEAIMQIIRSLEKRQFIVLESLYPEPIYAFRHAITQDVTYQTLLYDQRYQWHLSVGNVLEQLQPNNWERLAYHFAKTTDKERAYVYLVRAGERSAREFANQAAIEYWAQALKLNRSRKEDFELLCRRLELLMRIGDIEAVKGDLAQVAQLIAQSPENVNWQMRFLRYRAEVGLNTGDWEAAQTDIEQALALTETYRDLTLRWELYSMQNRVALFLNDPSLQQTATYQLRSLASELNDRAKTLRLMMNDLIELAEVDVKAALQDLQALHPQIEQEGDLVLEANYWNSISQIALHRAFYARAETALRTQLRLWRQVGNRRMEGNTLYNLGQVLYYVGQYSPAGAYLRDSYSLALQVSDRWGEAHTLVYLGALAFRRGAWGEAIAYIDRGLNYLESIKARASAGRALYLLGQIELAQNRPIEGRAYLHRAMEAFSLANQPLHTHQVQVAMAYSSALGMTLPFIEDIQSAANSLAEGQFQAFQTPDMTLWQLHYLLRAFQHPTESLRQTFLQFLDFHLEQFSQQQSRQHFLEMGHIPQLLRDFELDPLSLLV
jgi:class 3 adenylate cyclase/tetratricopeptide (TPR) repeat protein